jgi:hypothetical protein
MNKVSMLELSYDEQPTRLAQLEERSTFNRVVVGSIPTSGVLLLQCKSFAQIPRYDNFTMLSLMMMIKNYYD